MKCFIKFTFSFISAGLAPPSISSKDEYTLRFSNFLIIDLCDSSDNFWTFGPEDFLLKYL